jgi:hypothetical protein
MNNFFLRPWATGPVFSADEEGGGDEEAAASAREGSIGGAAQTPSTGSTPPGEVGRDYTGSIPQQTGPRGSSGAAFNQQPTYTAPFIPDDDDGSPDLLTRAGNVVFKPAGAGDKPVDTGGGDDDDDGSLFSRGFDFLKNTVGRTSIGQPFFDPLGTDRLQAMGEAKRAGEPKFSDAFGTMYYTPSDAAAADLITANQAALGNRDQAAGRTRDYGEGITTYTDYNAIDPATNLPYFLQGTDYNNQYSNTRGGTQYMGEEGRGMTYADKMAAMAPRTAFGGRPNYFTNEEIQSDPVYGPGGALDFDVTGGMVQGPSQTVTLPDGTTYEAPGTFQPKNYGTSLANIGQGFTRLLGSGTGAVSELMDLSSGNQLPSGAVSAASKDLEDLAMRKYNANLSKEQQDLLEKNIFGDGGGGLASLREKAINASPSLGGAILASYLSKNPSAAMAYGGVTYGGESRDAKNLALDSLFAEGTLDADPTFAKFYDQTGNREIALDMTKRAVNDSSVKQDLLVGATSGLITDRLMKGALIPKGTGSAITQALGRAPVVGPAIKTTGKAVSDTASALSKGLGRGVSNANQAALSRLSKIPVTSTQTLGQVIPKGITRGTSNLTKGLTVPPAARATGTGLKGILQAGAAEGFQEGPVENIATQVAFDRATGPGVSYDITDGAGMMDEAAVGALLGIAGGGNTISNAAIKAYNDARNNRPGPVGAAPTGAFPRAFDDKAFTSVPDYFTYYGPTSSDLSAQDAAAAAAAAGGNIDPFAINAPTSRGNEALVTQILNQRAQDAAAAAAQEASTGGAPQRAAFPDMSPTGQTNPLVSEILAGRNIPTAPGPEVNLDPASGLGPAFTDPAVAVARQAQAAQAAAARDASTGGAQQRAAFPDLAPSGETNPLVGEILAGRNVPSAPEQDARFTPEDTAITPVSNVIPRNEQGLNFTPPGAPQRGPDVDPTLLQKQSEIQALIEQGILNEEQAARMMAINTPRSTGDVTPANEFVGATQAEMNLNVPNNAASTMDTMAVMDLINNEIAISGELSMETARRIENNTPFSMVEIANLAEQSMGLTPSRTSGESRSVVSAPNILPMERAENQTGVAPFVFESEVMNDNVLRAPRPGFKGLNNTPLEDAVLADEIITPEGPNLPRKGFNNQVLEDAKIISPNITSTSGTATGTNTSGTNVTVDTSGNVRPVETTNINPYIDTTVFPPYDDTGGDVVVPPVGSGGDDDDTTVPPDDGGNCPPGYELRLINGMYVCVPIDQVEDEVEEEEETPAVTYGRPGIGVYYDPVTVGPISPYILNSDEVV